MDEKKLQEAFFDEAFVQSLFELNTAQEVQAALKQRGIALTLKDIETIKKQLAAQNDVMDETALTAVAVGVTTTHPPAPPVPIPPNSIPARCNPPRW